MAKLLLKCVETLQPALDLLSSNKFYWQVDRSQVSTLFDILNNTVNPIHEPVRLGIIAFLILKFPQQLTAQDIKALSEQLVKLLKSSNYKKVVAALLVRLPTYTSYKQVVPYLQPKLTPLCKMLQLSPKIKQSCSSLYQKQISKYRVEWCALSANSQLSFQAIEDIFNQLSTAATSDSFDGYELESRLETQTNYLLERISIMGTQTIDFNRICTVIEKLVAGAAYQLMDVREEIREGLAQIREYLKVSGLKILNALLSKLKRRFIRKFSWLLLVHQYCISSPSSAQTLLLSLSLTANILHTFGNGSLNLQQLLFTSLHSLSSLLTFLFRRKPVSNLKEQMQFRKDKHLNKPKQDRPTLNLNEPNKVFESLANISKHEESQLTLKVLQILRIYYSKPHDSNCQHTAQLLELIDLSEGKLSPLATEIYKEIKGLIMPTHVVFSADTEGIYEELWHQRTKRKLNKSQIAKVIQLTVTSNTKRNPAIPVMKRAVSEDLSGGQHHEIQGWGTPVKNKPDEPKPRGESEPSQMFYSFHDSRISRGIPQTANKPAVDEQFILTPSFE